jgi:hypothetical protein
MQTPPPIVTSARPKILTTAAVIAIIFGVIGALGSLPAVLAACGIKLPANDPVSVALQSDAVILRFQNIGGILGLVSSTVLLISGVSLLKCREWARKAMVAWGFYSILSTIAGSYVTFVHIMPITQKAMETMLKDMGQGAATGAQFANAAMMGGVAIGLLFGVGLAVALIVMATRPSARAACQSAP